MTPTTPSPISHERAFHIALVLEMSELPDRNSPEDDPTAMIADSNEMAGCIERALERADLVLVPPVSEPVAWWNGFRKDDDERDGLSGPAFSPVETTWHDIPLYAGVNPCNLSTAPTTGISAIGMLPDETLAEYQHRMLNLHAHTSPANHAASVLTDEQREAIARSITALTKLGWTHQVPVLNALLAASMGGEKA